jgi:ribonuclease P protein component
MSDVTGRFRRSDRLLDSRDFRRILRRGRRVAHRDIVVISMPIDGKHCKFNKLRDSDRYGSRLGVTASRKVGGAVVRNRFKRRIRAWFRERRSNFATDLDLVVIARKSGAQLSFGELDSRLSGLMGLELLATHSMAYTTEAPREN